MTVSTGIAHERLGPTVKTRLELHAAGCAVRQIVGRHLRDLSDETISCRHLLAMPAEVEWPDERLRCLGF